ncbi:MAG: endonuclease/exonuclease/phosphatase family protein [Proteobacteria bacterium]|nr:endonuclease/exonuclease/phosphatase family protein [Pseudomonadota bacterium]
MDAAQPEPNPPKSLRKSPKSLRVASANLCGGQADAGALRDWIEQHEIDVLATQELSRAQADAIRQILPHGDLDPTPDRRGMGLALRQPGEVYRVSLGYRHADVAQLDPDDWPELEAPLEVINVHLCAPHLYPPFGAMVRRRRQVRRLEAYLRNGANGQLPAAIADAAGANGSPRRVLVGDFNATPLWPLYRRISSHLTDAAVAVAQQRGRPLEPTWGPWPGAPRMLRIDHGFVGGVEVDAFEVHDLVGSDHSAIVMDLLPSS